VKPEKPGTLGWIVVGVALLLGTPSHVHADETSKACAASFEKSQYLARDNKLQDARLEAVACGASACPHFVREACQKELADIDAAQPTLVLAAQDAKGADLVDVRVEVDGRALLARLGAEAVPIDPGEHVLGFFRAGQPPMLQHVLVRVGEKNRLVKAVFSPPVESVAPFMAELPGTHEASSRGLLWPSIVVGALGVGTVAASIGVGLGAKNDADSLRETCAPACSASAVDSVNSRLIVSDVLLGAGVAVVGVATVLFFVRPGAKHDNGHETSALTRHLAPSHGGFAFTF
jgi:hypothetical protein